MSGAEAVGLVLGLISSAISIIDASQKIYEAAKDVKGMHAAFKEVAKNVPLVLGTLKLAEQAHLSMKKEWQSSTDEAKKKDIEQTAKEVKPVFETCKANTKALRDIFEEMVPGDEDGRMDRYLMAPKSVFSDKQHKVEDLMQEILKKLQLLHTHHYFKTAINDSEIKPGIQGLRMVKPSLLPQDDRASYLNSGCGPQNINSGSGKMVTNTISGGQHNARHIADNQTFHYGAKWRSFAATSTAANYRQTVEANEQR